MIETASIAIAPVLPWTVLGPLFALALATLLYGAFRRARGTGLRLLVMAALAAALINPSLVQEEREPIPDVAVVIIDESPSQAIGSRGGRADRALDDITASLSEMENIDLRIVRTGIDANRQLGETRLFDALDTALADVPRRRVAGTILLTEDGDPVGGDWNFDKLDWAGMPRGGQIRVCRTRRSSSSGYDFRRQSGENA